MALSRAAAIICLLLVVAVHATELNSCGSHCANNGMCAAPCSACVQGVCSSGQVCGAHCVVDTDCNQGGDCPYCTNGACIGNGAQCGAFCTEKSDCYGQCQNCLNSTCLSVCGGACTEDTDCESGTGCNTCIDAQCQASGCGARCFVNADCAGQGNCTMCINSLCMAGCQAECSSDDECGGGTTGCGYCDPTTNLCSPGQCGSACPPGDNNACGNSTCSLCSTTGVCVPGGECGAACVVNSDCDLEGTCNACIDKVCTDPTTKRTKLF